MNTLPSLGTAVSSVIGPTFQAYAPLLAANASTITSAQRRTFKYSSHPRQELDVYYPSTLVSTSSSPSRARVLVFLYGGGLVHGAKQLPGGLMYTNLGHFFAAKGYTVVIPDYRLIEHGATFPSGGEDVSLVVGWLQDNLAELGQGVEKGVQLSMMGNSAGGLHLATYLLGPHFEQSRATVAGEGVVWLNKVVFVGVPFDMQSALPARAPVNQAYFGARIEEDCPLGLLRAAKSPLEGLDVLVLTSSLDPDDEILAPNRRFVSELEKKGAMKELKVGVVEGHNHISLMPALGTGIEEEEVWGQAVVKFLES